MSGFLARLANVVLCVGVLVQACLSQDDGVRVSEQPLDRIGLQGRVVSQLGDPIAGARAYIYSAQPKEGPAFLCPSCYFDCGKFGVSDESGHITIEALDSTLIFRVLVVKDGFLAEFVPDVDPVKGSFEVPMTAIDLASIPVERLIRGQVVDGLGEPVVGATVSVEGWSSGNGGFTWGPPSRVMLTPLAATDDQGRFVLAAKSDLEIIDLEIECRNFAVKEFPKVAVGQASRSFVLNVGATVTGRLIHEGQPLPGYRVGLASANRRTRSNFSTQSIDTDKEGRFTFFNVPAGLDYYVTGEMASLRDIGATPIITTPALTEGETRDIGDMMIGSGLTIGGTIKMADGGAVPPDSLLVLSHGKIWRSQDEALDPSGRFEFRGVPPGQIELFLRMPNYQLSSQNRSYDSMNRGQLLATVSESARDLVVLVEPGSPPDPRSAQMSRLPPLEMPRSKPLRGVEPLPLVHQAARVTLVGIDSGSGEILDSIQATPGWSFSEGGPIWNSLQQIQVSSSDEAALVVEKRTGKAFLKIEADGYLPETVYVEGIFDQELTVAMKRGVGVSGVVLDANGEPVVGCEVVMVGTGTGRHGIHRVYMNRGSLGRHGEGIEERCITDLEGRFQFPPKVKPGAIVVAHRDGFAAMVEPNAAVPASLVLQDWGTVSGVVNAAETAKLKDLMITASRADPKAEHTNVGGLRGLIARFLGDDPVEPVRDPLGFLHLSDIYTVDEESGRFQIEKLPPGHWRIILMKVEERGGAFPGNRLLPSTFQEVLVEPGDHKEIELDIQ